MDIPGNMGRGNWKAAAFIDERSSDAAYDALVAIFSGAARGTTGLFGMLVSEFLGAVYQQARSSDTATAIALASGTQP